MQLAVVAANERLGQAVGVVDEVEGEAPLDAEIPLVREVLVLRGDLDDVLRLRVEVEVDLAADSAERARRPHLLERALGLLRALLELLVDRAGGADGEAAAAELALGVEPGESPGRDDARLAAAALERERRALHYLLRVAHAAVAEDAGVRVVAHQPVPVVVLLAPRVGEDERRLRSELVREIEELVRAPARRRVQVLGEEHLGQRLLEVGDLAVRRDDRALGDACGAGGHRSRRALDVDDAHAAPAVRSELRVVAQRGDERPVPRRRMDDQLPLGRAHRPAVERELDHGCDSSYPQERRTGRPHPWGRR